MRQGLRLAQRMLGALALAALITGGLSAAVAQGRATHRPTHRRGSVSKAVVIKLAKVSFSAGGKTVKTEALVTASGDPLYMLTGASTRHPLCTSSSCHSLWPPATSASKHASLASGIHAKLTVWHHNGFNQLVLAAHPLYRYAGDGQADIAYGQGIKSFGGTWKLLGASGSAAAVKSSSSSGSKHSGSGW
ncbi:MAG: hypothetical protein ACP5H2_11280 [Solirubrobacteraceae bacterium]